jgi:hypothetical protein
MRTRLIGVVALVIVVAAAYLAGSWPERNLRLAAETQAGALEAKAAAAEARVRTGELLGRVLTVKELAMRQDYGQALERSSALFDAIRGEAAMISDPRLRDGLNAALGMRDSVTARLAKGEPAAVESLHDMELVLRSALGYEMPPAANPVP